MKNKILLIGLLVLAIALSGCVGTPDAASFVKNLPEVQAFLEENPDADIAAMFLDQETVETLIGDIRERCGQQMQEVPYWKVTVTKGEERVEIYLDKTGQQALCIVKPGAEQPQHQCQTHEQCNDNNPATKDGCAPGPSPDSTQYECFHIQITECTTGDNYCPTRCSYVNDSDCQEETDCVETDGGVDYYVRGTTNPCPCDEENEPCPVCGAWVDQCLDGTTLLEYSCGNLEGEEYSCLGGCEEGACKADGAD